MLNFTKSKVQFSHSVVSSSLWPHGLQHSRVPCPFHFLELAQTLSTESMPSNHLILCHPLLLLPSIFSRIRVFSSELAFCIRWPKYWSFSFSISPSNEDSGLISFRIDWFDLLSVQGTLNSLPNTTVQSINSSLPSLLYGPTLPSIHDYWKNHGFNYTDLCRQSDVSAF